MRWKHIRKFRKNAGSQDSNGDYFCWDTLPPTHSSHFAANFLNMFCLKIKWIILICLVVRSSYTNRSACVEYLQTYILFSPTSAWKLKINNANATKPMNKINTTNITRCFISLQSIKSTDQPWQCQHPLMMPIIYI